MSAAATSVVSELQDERSYASAPLVVRDLSKSYGDGDTSVPALQRVNLVIEEGTFAAVTGPSGSGKSTLLHLIAGLERPSSGNVAVGGHDIHTLSQDELAAFRRRNIGLVFQFFNLLPTLSARENAALPLLLDGHLLSRVADRVDAVLDRLGVLAIAHKRPSQLSGGEMQRVAVARALVVEPRLILADEPTGSLDTKNGAQIVKLLRSAVDDFGVTVLVMTHDPRLTSVADRVIAMCDGQVDDEGEHEARTAL